jgi:hypothetical protein
MKKDSGPSKATDRGIVGEIAGRRPEGGNSDDAHASGKDWLGSVGGARQVTWWGSVIQKLQGALRITRGANDQSLVWLLWHLRGKYQMPRLVSHQVDDSGRSVSPTGSTHCRSGLVPFAQSGRCGTLPPEQALTSIDF